jgi:hypothetical protein
MRKSADRPKRRGWRPRAEVLEPRQLLAGGGVIISELLASNRSATTDGDGASSDWIELYNSGDVPLDLAGYGLSDDPDQPFQWRFPSQVLEAGEFLVVYASGQGVPDGQGNPHTNFRLDAGGEYLGLVRPDGSIASQFAPAYPPQRRDVSYGVDQPNQLRTLVDAATPARILVPDLFNGPSLGTRWTGADQNEPFDDASWTLGTAAIGYDLAGDVEPVNIAASGTATQSTTAFTRPADYAIDGNFDSFTHTDDQPGSWWRLEFPRPKSIGRIVLWNRVDCCAQRLSNFRVAVYDASDHEVFVQDLFRPSEGGGFVPQGDFAEIVLPSGKVGTTIEVRILGQNNEGNGYLSLSEVEVYEAAGFHGLFTTDVAQTMRDRNSSVMVRAAFDAVDLAEFQTVELRARYDDGFVAYVNGHEVARRNAPASTTWVSAALSDRPDAQATTVEQMLLADFGHWLRPRGNVLALQGLNDQVLSDDFLLAVELVGVLVTEGRPAYFTQPTPGKSNGPGVQGFVSEVEASAARGLYQQPFTTVLSSPTPGASLIYTTDGSKPTLLNGIRVDPPAADVAASAMVPISTTATLRATAFKPDMEPSGVATFTYIFPTDVLRQPADPPGMPAVWDGRGQDPIRADYAMDPRVVNDPAYRDEMIDGLTSIPSISLVMPPEDLFGAERGIYINSEQRGRQWERATSLEILQPDGSSFQADTGIRIHGYSWRYHSITPKHSFRLEFRDEYGPPKLEYPLFPDAPVSRFDSIVLRAQGGRAWAGNQLPHQAQYIRDAFARDTARDMGKIDGHAAFFHLYLNGLYWGLYHAVERPDAQMAEEYFGGASEDYDALNRRTSTNEAIDGDLVRYNEMIALANRGLATREAYEEIQRYVDVDNMIDFFLIHQYTTNQDGPETFESNNQRAIGSRVGDPKFRFFVWDMEYSMWNATDRFNFDVNVPTSISRVYTALRDNAEFRLRYADRAHRNLFNGGALTPEAAAARWMARATEIHTAILGESARWGDAIRSTPYTRDREWQTELNRLMTQYFPRRTGIMIEQLRQIGLYPAIDAPTYAQHGGQVPEGYLLEMQAPAGQIYYTLDGSDPRQPTAAGGGGVLVPQGATWKYLDNGSDQQTAWTQPDFDDQAWLSGASELGYGDGDEATVVFCGPSVPACDRGNFITTYFRHGFQVDDVGQAGELKLTFKRDDGAVIYLNGQEVARSNMPDGPIDHLTPALRSGNERVWNPVSISPAALRNGRNVIAVEIHQQNDSSNDISFDLELIATGSAGGEPGPGAHEYTGAVPLTSNAVVKSRVLQNGVWSALNEAEFVVGTPANASNLRISELHYHPADVPDAEFVELQNTGNETLFLNGVRFAEAFDFDFSTSAVTNLKPGQRVVVVQNDEAFRSRYPGIEILVAGAFANGRLDNGGERVVLRAADGSVIHDFQYADQLPWPAEADGQGPSLEVVDPRGDYNDPASWRASRVSGGTPGRGSDPPGDANHDAVFNSSDLVQVLQAGEYEDDIAGNSTWEEGDWNGDGDFDSRDLVLAFQLGDYSLAGAVSPLSSGGERRRR